MRNFKKNIIVLLLLAIIMATFAVQPVSAQNCDEPTGASMIADLFLVRPLSIAVTAAGCVVYVVALPFTVWGKDRLNAAGKNLVVVPGEYAFVRPIGEF